MGGGREKREGYVYLTNESSKLCMINESVEGCKDGNAKKLINKEASMQQNRE